MIAMILSAGRGERLKPLTFFMPKTMVPVCGKPVMEYAVDLLAQHDFKSVIANLHYMPDQIERYFGNGQRWGINLSYSLEKNIMGTAGAIKRIEDIFEETFCVVSGDVITDIDLTAMLEFHRQKEAAVTIALNPNKSQAHETVFEIDGQGRITRLLENTQDESQPYILASMGIYFLEPDVLKYIPAETDFDLINGLLPLLLTNNQQIYGYKPDCYWTGLENFSELQAAQTGLLDGKHERIFLTGHMVSPGRWQGLNASISPNASIIAPVLIGDNCQIQDHAAIGPYTVIGNNVIVAESATVANSTILAGTYVGKLVNVKDSIVNRNCLINIPSNTSVFLEDNFLLSDTGEAVLLEDSGRAIEWVAAVFLFVLTIPLLLIAGFLAIFSGNGKFVEEEHRISNNPRMLADQGKIGWREIVVRRFRADPTSFIGRWLTRTGMRYMPALLSVIKGDLALVGTGPLAPEQLNQITEEWHHQRFHTKTGLTGLWYINRKNYPNHKMSFDDQMIEDSFYAVTRTWQEDLRIFLKSIPIWLRALL